MTLPWGGEPLTAELSLCTEPPVAPSSETHNLRHGKPAFVRSGEGGEWRRGCWLEEPRQRGRWVWTQKQDLSAQQRWGCLPGTEPDCPQVWQWEPGPWQHPHFVQTPLQTSSMTLGKPPHLGCNLATWVALLAGASHVDINGDTGEECALPEQCLRGCLSSGHHNRLPQTEWLKQQKFFSQQFWRLEV